jgi:type VI secretion system protein ImpM
VPADAVTVTSEDAPGFFGKLPARGDFIGRRLSRPFIEAWDGWLQQAVLASREALGQAWLATYLISPLWRFATQAEACGPAAAAGVMMPSVDAVGRYYPLMLGREFPKGLDGAGLDGASFDPARFLPQAEMWFRSLEDLALATLADGFDLATLDRPVPLRWDDAATSDSAPAPPPPHPGLRIGLDAESDVAALCRPYAGARSPQKLTLWWTSGSDRVAPSLLLCPGMPPPAACPALLDGDWSAHGWAGEAAPVGATEAADDAPAWDCEE